MSRNTISPPPRQTIRLEPPPRMVRPIRRRPWIIGLLLVFAITLMIALGTPLAPHVVKPGDLSLAHSQILEGTLTQDRCATCHDNVSAETWSGMRTSGHAGIDQETASMTDRCVQCHHQRIAPKVARSAHNLSVEDRLRLTQRLHRAFPVQTDSNRDRQPDPWVTRVSNQVSVVGGWIGWGTETSTNSQDDVACSVCHREHHGVHANLSAVTDAQCQTCHSRQFDSFADGHPEFDNYPASSARTIAFDHVRHANLHYPKQAESNTNASSQFDCRTCHLVTTAQVQSSSPLTALTAASDPVVGTLPFETACASCHDEKLKVAISNGPALISLPTFPTEVTRQLESWPEAATGSPDGELSGWMKLLLTAQDPALDLEGLTNLGRVDWRSPERLDQAVRLARAIRTFAIDLSVQGQPWLRDLAVRAGAREADAVRLARSFQPQLMRDAVKEWFGQASTSAVDRFSARPESDAASNGSRLIMTDDLLLDDSSGGDELLGDWSSTDDPLVDEPIVDDPLIDQPRKSDPLVDDPLIDDPLMPGPPSAGASRDWQAEVDRRFDPAKTQSFGGWYRDDLTLSLRYRGTGHADEVLRVLVDLSRVGDLQSPQDATIASCIECHQNGSWKAEGITGLRDRLAKFTHRPHLDIRGLQDCRHCHSLASPSVEVASKEPSLSITQVSTQPRPHGVVDFAPLQKAACVTCHTSTAAGDHCTTCHRYHVGEVP
ncbi:cytochrome c3 family protein [Neorhodopirellula pilleata]|uniref:Outer membrane cytochrome MtrC/MtrF-like domain-containing protein n=1 Tax=Neorhodopirellula pilleata TaxID=2714738 RepID=A0A5C5ZL05_9BACT|nr:cytochrome c3 family protein [Neorhodopirellula pilleata]TWT87806.1 hypothetical protein Pla100_59010 [Neorhodopirellula pilleata]